ncbi:hypothetical protein ACGFNU_14700 [Spirillospora sp. NPDC048911]|uniref:hypothetical protein n=1 Tax=Spirillospora sp. NPDC048911 TaxID=3364527 RepID=UPI0037106FC6
MKLLVDAEQNNRPCQELQVSSFRAVLDFQLGTARKVSSMGFLEEYDGVIIGAGHNWPITRACLCRAGLKVLPIDRAQHVGGGLTTAEDNAIPGVFHATHAVSFRGIDSTPTGRGG